MDLTKINLKKILAIDYGQKYTGLASYKVGVDPYPLMFGRIKYENDQKLVTDLNEIIEEEFVDILLIGIPYFTDGSESTMTKTVKTFAKLLGESTNIPLMEQDEALTTFEAKERMKSDPRFNFEVDLTKVDALSACIILEEYVNYRPK